MSQSDHIAQEPTPDSEGEPDRLLTIVALGRPPAAAEQDQSSAEPEQSPRSFHLGW
jgi:hypothetical protein